MDRSSFSVSLPFSLSPLSYGSHLLITRHVIGHHCPPVHGDPEQRTRRSTACHGAPLSSSLFALSARARLALRKLRPLTPSFSLVRSLSLPIISLGLLTSFSSVPVRFSLHRRYISNLADLSRARSAKFRQTTADDYDDGDSIKSSRV